MIDDKKPIMNIASLFLLILISIFDLNAQNANNKDLNWEKLEVDNYKIEYPSNWYLSQKGEMGTKFFLFTKLESKTDAFSENINLIVQDLSSYNNINLDKYTEISEKQIGDMISNSKIIESNRIKREGLEFHKIIYTGIQGKLTLKFLQYYFVNKEKAYVLTFSAEKNTFSKYIETAEKILNSFKITD